MLIERISRDAKLVLLAGFYAFSMVTLAIAGALKSFTRIPIWDEWDAVVRFIMQVQDGNRAVWIEQHNEHRLLLSRLFVWLDWQLFGGKSMFLPVVNLIIIATIAYLLWRLLEHARHRRGGARNSTIAMWLFFIGALFYWSQSENLGWGFQVHFFLLQLLPLAAFYSLARWIESKSASTFALATVFGILAGGALTSGLLVLPIMAIYISLLGRHFSKAAVLIAISLLMWLGYFHNYTQSALSSGFTANLFHHPINALRYVVQYFGSPFVFITGGTFVTLVATMAGMAFFTGVVLVLWRMWTSRNRQAFDWALVAFLAFVVAATIATASGRLALGVSQAISSRYTTSAIMGWIILCIALYSLFYEQFIRSIETIFISCVILGTLMLRSQVHALDPQDSVRAPQTTALLALSLGIKDDVALAAFYPDSQRVFDTGQQARDRSMFVFNDYPFSGLKTSIGRSAATLPTANCLGSIETTPIASVTDYVQVSGWLMDEVSNTVPQRIELVDSKGTIVGYALSGYRRPEIAAKYGQSATFAGFVGYLKSTVSSGTQVTAIGDSPSCLVSFTLP